MEAQELRIGVNREHKEREGRIKLQAILKSKVDQLLKIKWSPEQTEGRANIDKYERVSKECIYQYVYEDKRKGGDLWSNLRHSHRSRRRRKIPINKGELSKTEYVLKIDQRLLNLKKVWRLGRRYYSRKES
ncbi:MAG: hypothetical protein IPK61_16785 [Saprospiraceae bacterium]|nr:hypothetical protein [Saprospiraceae bacterium]